MCYRHCLGKALTGAGFGGTVPPHVWGLRCVDDDGGKRRQFEALATNDAPHLP